MLLSQSNFYVYEHVRLDTNKPFYVGKGKDDRATKTGNRSEHWKRIAKKHGFAVLFVAKELDEELALLAEQERINQLKILGYDLCNKTDGGEGSCGAKFSEEHKRKLKESNIGQKRSKEFSEKLSIIKGKKVFCVTDNLFFSSTFEAANHYKCHISAIRRACNGSRKTAKRKQMRYANEKDMQCYQHIAT
jgi:hypothetical protein